MLVDFRVKNYALIDELEIQFRDGLNVLTGETGAGKSIIIGALEILLGARASSDLIRTGQETAYIEAVFEPRKLKEINSYLMEVGIEPEEKMILLSREIRENGRNRNRINGQLATAGMIKEISRYLVDIHGQHEHQLILDSTSQLDLLDEFIVDKESKLKDMVAEKFARIKELRNKLLEIEIDETEKARQIDLLEFQISEIENAGLQEDEMEGLEKEYKILTNMEDIYTSVGSIYNAINGEDYNKHSTLEEIGFFMKEMENIKDYDSNLEEFYDIIKDIYYQLEELGFQLHNYYDSLEYDDHRLKIVESRISQITALQRKYGKTVSEILTYKDEIKQSLSDLKSQDLLIKKLRKELHEIEENYYETARKLSKIRQAKAVKLEEMISQELIDLAMKDTILKIKFKEKKLADNGIDRVEFMISTNRGEELKPLAKIASGGELSRIMLALKTIIAHIDQVDTLIFDEVDSGVGGKTAQMMAEKLALISQKRQVICITHLPQIASMADNHFFISKKTDVNHTYTDIYSLDQMGQKEELARMLGGVTLTDTTMKHAEEMLTLADDKKSKMI
ncbi:DNA repair protein RecN [Iocasia frigidifontis]|uniref:DNA repair protein RecN n=1 Tax=Iocasia fonsfrigidae TaxID=2682810 RepID=A0A8A7KI24_9FIRM|nr:DNA repair protein RecN [Iocasia fonsfrigidae]QTL98507.1 DNA repair protein RecN [Iocasia fonsfrigidae]